MAQTKPTQNDVNFSGLSTQTNTGTAGGTLTWINLGGLKILWFVTTWNSASTSPTVVFPTLFTSTPVITTGVIGSAASTTGQYIVTGSASSTGFTYYSGTNPQGAFYIAIGT